MNTFIKIINGSLIVIGMLAAGCVIGVLWSNSEAKQAGYFSKLNAHVILHGDDQNHDCEYSPEWCNPTYRNFLLEKHGLKKASK